MALYSEGPSRLALTGSRLADEDYGLRQSSSS
jgi:hypothetical protein